ncbi:MAG: translocation/assembly module TamB domain-containing protein [Saprospiraceae bacterium]|nr:translocation/assembly module TamB domain-containing protein [Saprospiraceae bacterium]
MEEKKVIKKDKQGNKGWKILLYTLLSLIILPILLSLLLNLSPVQNYVANKLANYMSERMDAKVGLSNIDIDFAYGLELKGFHIVQGQDTVLNCNLLEVSLLQNLFSLTKNKLSLNAVSLDQPQINLVVKKGENITNLEKLLNKLFKPKEDDNTNKKSIAIILKSLDITGLKSSLREENSGMFYHLNCAKFRIDIDKLDPTKKQYLIANLKLNRPEINIEKFQRMAEVESPQEVAQIDSLNKVVTTVTIKSFQIEDGLFNLNDLTLLDKQDKNHFDSKHFNISQFNFKVQNLAFNSNTGLEAQIDHLGFIDENGFQLTNLQTDKLVINKSNISLSNFNLATNNSNLGSEISLKFKDWATLKTNPEAVNMDARLVDNRLDLKELFYFLPALEKNDFLAELSKDQMTFSAQVFGNLNQLALQRVNANLGKDIYLKGNLVLNDITSKELFNMNLGIEQLSTQMTELKRLLPKLNLPENFNKFGSINYVGNFDGTPKNFNLDGTLKTDIGSAILDMSLDIRNGTSEVKYAGDINLKDFDLGAISNNKELGLATLNLKFLEGYSFDLSKSDALFKGEIKSLEFKDYLYTNVLVDGEMNNGKFDGKIHSTDPNLDFDFIGNFLYGDEGFTVGFDSEIRQIDLQKLNLSKTPLILKGKLKIDGTGQSLNTFIGTLEGKDVYLQKSDTIYALDDIVMQASNNAEGVKQIKINNKDLSLSMEGKVDIAKVVNDVKLILHNNLPYYTKSWNIPDSNRVSNNQDFRFDIDVKSLESFADILGIKNISIQDFKGKGYLNSSKNEIQIASTFPFLAIKENSFYNGTVYVNLLNKVGYLNVHADSSRINKTKIGGVDIGANVEGDTINWNLTSNYIVDSVERVAVRGIVSPHPEGYQLRILNNDLKIYNKRWKLNPDNLFAFGKQYINIENFTITDGSRTIELDDIVNKGLLLKINRFRFDAVNAIIKDKKFYFDGEVISSLRINNVFESSPDIYGTFLINDLSINGDNYGNLNLDISKPLNEPLESILSIENNETKLAIKSTLVYDPDSKVLLSNIKGRKVPLKFLEYILVDGVSDVKGYVDVDGTIEGTTNNIKINADGTAYQGNVKVVYLGENYRFDNQKFKISENFIDLTGSLLYDSEGNEGVITGGLTHRLFKNFGVNANIEGENVIAINTTKADNPIYYGKGKGQISVDITGPVNKINMVINAVTRQGTQLNIPITESAITANKNIITFIDKDTFFSKDGSAGKDTTITVSGMNIEMNLTLTTDAQINMIFDETIGDVIKGRGNGNLRIVSPRAEPLQIYGSYEIEEGEYLFTAKKIVNKPFVVRRGGTLRWTGDPINAQINLEADYLVRTPLQNFLQEFLYNTSLQTAATQRTDVNVKLLIGNTLYNPTIQFDFEFPQLSGELKNYAETKTRLLRNNISDFNGQVFSLIIWNSFLPSNTLSDIVSSSGILESAGINTLSEFLSSQVSLFVTSLLNDALSENGLISGVDFNLSLRNNSSFNPIGGSSTVNTQSGILPSEIELRLNPKFRVLNERLEFNVGGNYIRQNSIGQVNYIVPDFAIQYAITSDRKLVGKVYGRYDFDEIQVNARRQKYGLGLRFRTEFGSMLETESDLSDFFKKNIVIEDGKSKK